VSGPARGYGWIRNGSGDLTAREIVASCEDSLRRLRTDVVDLYQIHWPARNVPMFGGIYFDPVKDRPVTPVEGQLEGLARLIRDGKVRHIGLSNETPYGVAEFVRVAESHGLPRVATVQNPYCLVNRSVDNGLDEVLYRHQVSLLAYSPLGFGLLTGKYDAAGLDDATNRGRLARFDAMKQQRWGRPEALAAARRYNALARSHGLTPTRMALAWCFQRWIVASTIIGVTSAAQLDENLAAWGTPLPAALLSEIDALRWECRDPAQ
jgi:aryl-alcohol dehydrogenase-like predicted oxidoreductase